MDDGFDLRQRQVRAQVVHQLSQHGVRQWPQRLSCRPAGPHQHVVIQQLVQARVKQPAQGSIMTEDRVNLRMKALSPLHEGARRILSVLDTSQYCSPRL